MLIIVLIFFSKAYLEARSIEGIWFFGKNVCYLGIHADLCREITFGVGKLQAWCDEGWNHDCCFFEPHPIEGLHNCKETSRCHYECRGNHYYFKKYILNIIFKNL